MRVAGGLEASKKQFYFGRNSVRRHLQGRCVEKNLVIPGRPIGPVELERVRGLLAAHLDWSRYRLSRDLCLVYRFIKTFIDGRSRGGIYCSPAIS